MIVQGRDLGVGNNLPNVSVKDLTLFVHMVCDFLIVSYGYVS